MFVSFAARIVVVRQDEEEMKPDMTSEPETQAKSCTRAHCRQTLMTQRARLANCLRPEFRHTDDFKLIN